MRGIKRGSNWDKLVKWYEDQEFQMWEEWWFKLLIIEVVIVTIWWFLAG